MSPALIDTALIETALTDTALTDTALTDTALTDTALTDTALTGPASIHTAPIDTASTTKAEQQRDRFYRIVPQLLRPRCRTGAVPDATRPAPARDAARRDVALFDTLSEWTVHVPGHPDEAQRDSTGRRRAVPDNRSPDAGDVQPMQRVVLVSSQRPRVLARCTS